MYISDMHDEDLEIAIKVSFLIPTYHPLFLEWSDFSNEYETHCQAFDIIV